MRPKTIMALLISSAVLIIMLQNTQPVTIYILFWQIVLPQILMIFLTLLAGFFIWYLVGTLKTSSRKFQ